MSGRQRYTPRAARQYRESRGSHSVRARHLEAVHEAEVLERAAAAPHATPAMRDAAEIAAVRSAVIEPPFTNRQLNDATLRAVTRLLRYVAEKEQVSFAEVVNHYRSMFRAGVRGTSNVERINFQQGFAEDVMNVILSHRRLGDIASTEAARREIRRLFDYTRSGINGVDRVRGVLEADFKHIKPRVNARGGYRKSHRKSHRKSRHRKTVRRS